MGCAAAFPQSNVSIRLRDELGTLYADELFTPLFAMHGRPAESSVQSALVTALQFAEGLSDPQAADAVRSRIDWKYALRQAMSESFYTLLREYRAHSGLSFDTLSDLVITSSGYLHRLFQGHHNKSGLPDLAGVGARTERRGCGCQVLAPKLTYRPFRSGYDCGRGVAELEAGDVFADNGLHCG